jgi:hypothetical protein
VRADPSLDEIQRKGDLGGFYVRFVGLIPTRRSIGRHYEAFSLLLIGIHPMRLRIYADKMWFHWNSSNETCSGAGGEVGKDVGVEQKNEMKRFEVCCRIQSTGAGGDDIGVFKKNL